MHRINSELRQLQPFLPLEITIDEKSFGPWKTFHVDAKTLRSK